MLLWKGARILVRVAALLGLLIIAGCGASNHTMFRNPSGPYDTPQNIAAYRQAINGFQQNGGEVQALMFHVLVPGDVNYDDFLNNILPNVSGVSIGMSWNEIESSNAQGTGSGGYDFSSFDAELQPYAATGKQVNLIVWPATEGGNNDPGHGGSTPTYVFTQAWSTTVGAPNPLDMTVCQSYKGDSSNPYYNSAKGGNGGVWNVDSSVSNASDLSGLPVSYEAPFMVAYQNFIVQVIKHYNLATSPRIGYIRFGFSQGGENSPECNQYWPGYSQTAYLNYVKTMTDFVKAQNPSMTILEDLHAVGPAGQVVYGYANTEAADAVADNFGFGTNGLQQSDTANFGSGQPCDSNWCQLFSQYPGGVRSLQTLQWSDPTGELETGSLSTLIPFAQQHGASNLELYLADLALAYSSDYCNYEHAVC